MTTGLDMECPRLLLILSLSLFFAQTLPAPTDYWVGPNGTSGNSGATRSTPKDLQSALNLLQPGARALLIGGVYPATTIYTMTNWGTSFTTPIYITAETNGAPIIQSNTIGGLDLQDSRWLIVEGLTVRSNDGNGVKMGAWQIFRKNKIVGNGTLDLARHGQGISANSIFAGTNTIENNFVLGNGWLGHNLDHGIYFSGRNTTVRGNTVISNASYGLHCYQGNSASSAFNHDILMEGNFTQGHVNRAGILSFQDAGDGPGTNRIFNNTVLDGMWLQYGTQEVSNNIIYPGFINAGEPIYVGSFTFAFNFRGGNNLSSVRFSLDPSIPEHASNITNAPAYTVTIPGWGSGRPWLVNTSVARNRAGSTRPIVRFFGETFSIPKADIGCVDWNRYLDGDSRDLKVDPMSTWFPLWDTLIPPARLLSWSDATAGVPGGSAALSATRTQFCNVTVSIPGTNIVAVGNGVANDQPAIQAALNRCPTNAFVYMPIGRYNCTTNLDFNGNNRMLRGAGAGAVLVQNYINETYSTNTNTLVITTNILGNFFNFGSYSEQGTQRTNIVDIFVGQTNTTWDSVNGLGASFPGVDGTVKFWVNDAGTNTGFAAVSDGDGSADPVHYYPSGGTKGQAGAPLVRFLARITGTNAGNQVFFSPPSPYFFPANKTRSQYLYVNELKFSALEDFSVECNGRISVGIYMSQAMGCWIKGVKVTQPSKARIAVNYSTLCDITECVLDGAPTYGPSQGIGLHLDSHTYGFKIYDNTMRSNFPAIELYLGASGHAIVYNYFLNSQGGLAPIDSHNAHNFQNLIEGNVGYGLIQDGYFGGAEKWTLFRNWFHGNESDFGARKILNLDRGTRDFNMAANVLGNPLTNWGAYLQQSGWNNSNTVIRRYGYPSMGNDTYSGANTTIQATNSDYMDYYVWTNALDHANIEYGSIGTWSTNYNALVTNRTYAYSYFTNWNVPTKPEWWANPGRTDAPWPPIGPDIAGHTNLIPAMMRFHNLGSIAGGGGPPPLPSSLLCCPK